MRDLLLITLDGQEYGIWKDEILSVKDLDTLHRIPLSPACIAGISIIDDHTITLADLSVCVGHASARENEKGKLLLMPGREKVTGFMVKGEVRSLQVPSQDVLPIPDSVKIEVIDTCAVHDGLPIPVINISVLYDQILHADDDSRPANLRISNSAPLDFENTEVLRVLEIAGDLFAISAAGIEADSIKSGVVSPLPRTPEYLKGVMLNNGKLIPVIDLAQRIKRRKTSFQSRMIVTSVGGAMFGLLIDGDLGAVAAHDLAIKAVPAIAQSSWIRAAAVREGEVIPLIDIGILLAGPAEDRLNIPLSKRYRSESRLHEVSSREDIEVLEFSLLGVRHALPKSEVVDVIPVKPFREIPDTPPIVLGLTEHNEELLPVIDLAVVFGIRSLVTSEWSLIEIKNGDFRALVIAEEVFGEKKIAHDILRSVPILLPHRVVYGCYPDADAVRLILNVEAIALHCDTSLVKELLPVLSSQIKQTQTPVEIVHSSPDEREVADKSLLPVSMESETESLTEEPLPLESDAVSNRQLQESFTQAEENITTGQEEQNQDQKEIVEQKTEQNVIVKEREEEAEAQSSMNDVDVPDAPVGIPELEGVDTAEEHEEITAPVEALSDPEKSIVIEEETVKEVETTPEQPVADPVNTLEERQVKESLFEEGRAEEPEPEPEPEPVTPSISFRKKDVISTEGRNLKFPGQKARFLAEFILSSKSKISHVVRNDKTEGLEMKFVTDMLKRYTRLSRDVWKRGIAYGAVAAVLAATLYFFGSSNRPVIEKQVKETTHAKIDPVKIETSSPHRTEKPKPSLVLEVPAHRPLNVNVYTVIKGDTLWIISKRLTGNPLNYPHIAGDNRIADPDLIFPGQMILLKKKQ